MKFGRTYKMTVQVGPAGTVPNTVIIEYPLTLEFNVVRSMFASANTGKFTIYNLKDVTRKKIFHDRYDVSTLRGITLQAGYVDQKPLPIIFQGTLTFAYSNRHRVDWHTEIEAFDGGHAMMNSQASKTFPAATSMTDVFRSLFSSLKSVSAGAIGSFQNNNERGLTLVGNSWDMISDLAKRNGDGIAFIDNEKAHVLKPNEYISNLKGLVPVINSATGLLKTQRRFKGRVDVDMVFEPRVALGQRVTLESEESMNNGDYRVDGFTHSGTISGAVAGAAVTTLNLWQGTSALEGVRML